MHIVSMSRSNDDDAATQRWAQCSLLDDIASSNGTLPLPTIYSTRAGTGGGGGGRGLRMTNLSTSGGVDGDTGFFYDKIHDG